VCDCFCRRVHLATSGTHAPGRTRRVSFPSYADALCPRLDVLANRAGFVHRACNRLSGIGSEKSLYHHRSERQPLLPVRAACQFDAHSKTQHVVHSVGGSCPGLAHAYRSVTTGVSGTWSSPSLPLTWSASLSPQVSGGPHCVGPSPISVCPERWSGSGHLTLRMLGGVDSRSDTIWWRC
jgi:hypothetical protein